MTFPLLNTLFIFLSHKEFHRPPARLDPGEVQQCRCTPFPPLLLLSLADSGAEGASQPLLPCSSHRLHVCGVPSSTGDSSDVLQVSPSRTCSLLVPAGIPQWPGAQAGRRNLCTAAAVPIWGRHRGNPRAISDLHCREWLCGEPGLLADRSGGTQLFCLAPAPG